jgi:uncharacterized protein
MSQLQSDFERWFSGAGRTSGSHQRRGGGKFFVVVAIVLGLIAVGSIGKGIYTEWLWFGTLGFQSVYGKILGTRVLLFAGSFALFAALFAGNIFLATRLSPRGTTQSPAGALAPVLQRLSRAGVIAITAFLSLMFGLAAQANWETVLRFTNGQAFATLDPVFFRDTGFYVFTLPFLSFVRGWLLTAVIFSVIAAAMVYLISYSTQRRAFDNSRPVLIHVGSLVIAIAALAAMSYWLGIWELVYSPRGAVFGAGYTDMTTQVPAQWILMVATLLLGVLVLVALVRRRVRFAAYGVGLWIVLGIVVGQVIPGLVQRLQVEPNELNLETEFIEYNMAATREAFGLNRIVEVEYPANPMPSAEDVAAADLTIKNVRLWDHRPLLDTYNQIQTIRTYYEFLDVDIDRYTIDGEYRQVMLAARELSKEKLPSQAQTWVNKTLQYTHGYGVAMSPVNEVTREGGLPNLWLRDIPPIGKVDFTRPEIYFGEKTRDYVIVGTNTEEFDYPVGNTNAWTMYQGTGGVPIGNLFRRALYAWEFSDFNILISSQMTQDSKILYHRQISERVNRIAPFLSLDADPYVVVLDGRLVWVLDCYTTSDRYPYSEPLGNGVNYIRNSVKAVIDAYDGTVDFYVTEPDDPILQTYASIFPVLFKPMDAMPAGLRAHLRYPVDMFDIQSSVYRTYHMQDARVFYNKEDLWAVPMEFYVDREQPIQPYYIIMRLPEEETEEFLLMLPFTPANRNNAIGWLAARCDGDDYGALVVYRFPKDRLIYGPSQIENRIQQDTIITEQLALWSRGGSQVIRGNLLVIPVANSTIYVEGIFLQADAGGLPELKRVIVAAGDEIAMRETLDEALFAIFGTGGGTTPPPTTPPGEVPGDVRGLIEKAQGHFDRAQAYLQQGNWAGYGSELEALEQTLAELALLTE